MFPPARSRAILLAAMAGLPATAGRRRPKFRRVNVVGAGGLRLL